MFGPEHLLDHCLILVKRCENVVDFGDDEFVFVGPVGADFKGDLRPSLLDMIDIGLE